MDFLLYVVISILISMLGGYITLKSIPLASSLFIAAGLHGKDLCKRESPAIPESMGLVNGTAFLISMFLFLGLKFGRHFLNTDASFPHNEFSEFLTALLCICCMLLLGFADDVLNLKWRYKLIFPTIASLPLLLVYYINFGSTTVIVPKPFRILLGFSLNIGPLYYLYMSLLAVYCTNAINIYAGINGLESGQSVVISLSICVFNMIEMSGYQWKQHLFSFTFMLPFSSVCMALYYFNRYPSRVFVGDTFTYFAGMTFAVVAILGHFSKSVLLFFIPQIINFVYSMPQLLRLVPCPRHRLPRYNSQLDVLEASKFQLKAAAAPHFLIMSMKLLSRMKLISLENELIKGEKIYTCNNLTIINLVLVWTGHMHESKLTNTLLWFQIASSIGALLIRYPLANFFYD